MAAITEAGRKKYINTVIMLGAMLLVYIAYAFFQQLGDWFDLEAKWKHFKLGAQGLALFVGAVSFIYVIKNSRAMEFLNQVYGELIKVIWPDKDSVTKLTMGIIVFVAICSGVLILVDYTIQMILSLIYEI